MEKERIDKQFDFIKEIDKEKMIKRQTFLSDGVTKENDAEHAWHMSIMTILLSEYASEPIDVLKTITMILIHDLVEIKAGDTYAYDEQAKLTQKARELEAADYIFSMLPEDQGKKLRGLWDEFEAGSSPEARFAKVMDNIQPMMLNALTGGKLWAQNGVKLSQIMNRNKDVPASSETLWKYAYENFIQPNVEKGTIITEDEIYLR